MFYLQSIFTPNRMLTGRGSLPNGNTFGICKAERCHLELKRTATISRDNLADRLDFIKLVQVLANAHIVDERFIVVGTDQKERGPASSHRQISARWDGNHECASGTKNQVKRVLRDLSLKKSNWFRRAGKKMAKTIEKDWREYFLMAPPSQARTFQPWGIQLSPYGCVRFSA
jgi:hypothetical protein